MSLGLYLDGIIAERNAALVLVDELETRLNEAATRIAALESELARERSFGHASCTETNCLSSGLCCPKAAV